MTAADPHNHRHPYYIVAPDYRDSSAGVRVMHRLCHILNMRGLEAYLIGADSFNPQWNTPQVDTATAQRHRRENRIPIAVYSDITTGNPLNALVCVRYMLNREGVIEGNPITSGPEDLFFYYSMAFTPSPAGRYDYLRLNTHDLELFKPAPELEKTGPLLYLNRIPESDVDFAALPPDIQILSNKRPLSLPDLARRLQTATALYAYEASTTCTLAMLCGCPVVAMTLPGHEGVGFSKRSLSIYGGRGYALTDNEDELRAARESLPAIRAGMLNTQRAFEGELEVFIAKTQEKAHAVAQKKPASAVQDDHYQEWIARRPFKESDASAYARLAAQGAKAPQFHLAVVHDSNDAQELVRTLRSLAAQHYSNVLVTVASTLPAPPNLNGPSLTWIHDPDCWGAAAGALQKGSPGDWVGLLRAGDQLAPHALLLIAEHLRTHPQLRALYTDEDIVEQFGTRHTPRFKPDFSPRLLNDSGYTGGILLARRQDWHDAGGWRHLPDYADESDLAIRLARHVPGECFGHVADVLYHRGSGHPALRYARPPGTHPLAGGRPHQPAAPTPQVSILIPTRDQLPSLQRCIESLFEQTPDIAFELILVDHLSTDAEARAFLAGLPAVVPDRIKVIPAEGDFNFCALINLAARHARGDFLFLLNNDTAALHPEWLFALLAEMEDPAVGIASPRLLFPDGRIQHAGAVLGLFGTADYPWVGTAMDDPGYLEQLAHTREVSAVSGAALLIRRSLFETLGGMDESFAIAFGDIDLCLRAGQAGYRCIWTPHATLLHEAGLTLKSVFATPQAAEAAQREFVWAKQRLVKKWLPQLAKDPYYNVNLSLTSRRFEIEGNPALQSFGPAEAMHRRIFALPADDGGSGEYRVRQPAAAAARQRHAAVRLAAGYPKAVHFERLGIQTLFSQRQVDDNHLQALAELRDLLPDLRIVMDFDDLLTAVPQHSIHHAKVWKDMPRRLEALGRLCDCLTVSTPALAEAMRAYHDDIRHIPNGIDPSRWPAQTVATRPATAKLRVGWAGGISHAGDLAVIRELVAALADEVEWVFLGMCLEEMRPLLAEFHEGVPFADYPRKLAELSLDLAIAPLELNHFNECKSNLRLLEYGALGIPVIATDILPYRCGLPVTLVDNRAQSWIRAVRERVGERSTLQHDGMELRKAVLRNWTIDKTLPAWISAWTA